MLSDFRLAEEQFNEISPLLPNTSRGVPRVDDRLDDRPVLSGIIFRIQRGGRWSDVPSAYGPAKTLCNRYRRCSGAGVFGPVFEALARDTAGLPTLLIDAGHVRTHRRTADGVKKTPAAGAAPAKPKAG